MVSIRARLRRQLFIATFFAYNLLTTGAFLLYYGIYWSFRIAPAATLPDGRGSERGPTLGALQNRDREGALQRPISKGILIPLRTTAVALFTTVSLYLLLWAATGYNAPAAFRHSLHSRMQPLDG